MYIIGFILLCVVVTVVVGLSAFFATKADSEENQPGPTGDHGRQAGSA